MQAIARQHWRDLRVAALDKSPVSGLTHNFYRYPARFSPKFAATAIRLFSRPGDLVLDPYMGGGTTVVEAIAAERRVIGNDLNSLAAFVAKVKTTALRPREIQAIRQWCELIPSLNYRAAPCDLARFIDGSKMRNLNLVCARFIRKVIALTLASISTLPTTNAQDFAKCVLLRVSQWALDGKKSHTSLSAFRRQLVEDTERMLYGMAELMALTDCRRHDRAIIANIDAEQLAILPIFAGGQRANLVVTSPPYPGVHVLYHRWQVDGRRETPAPYWITGTSDGQGASFYNFGDRHDPVASDYFDTLLRTLYAIRNVMRQGGIFVQLVAFSDPSRFLSRYLENMNEAGFKECRGSRNRIWRQVPNRRWHATAKGSLAAAREVVLVHEAV